MFSLPALLSGEGSVLLEQCTMAYIHFHGSFDPNEEQIVVSLDVHCLLRVVLH